ncbi:hypothetical protein BGW41_006012, partial [Actinomortierella wolfii]
MSIPESESHYTINEDVQMPTVPAITPTVTAAPRPHSIEVAAEEHCPPTLAPDGQEESLPPYTSRELAIAYSMVTPRKSDPVHPLEKDVHMDSHQRYRHPPHPCTDNHSLLPNDSSSSPSALTSSATSAHYPLPHPYHHQYNHHQNHHHQQQSHSQQEPSSPTSPASASYQPRPNDGYNHFGRGRDVNEHESGFQNAGPPGSRLASTSAASYQSPEHTYQYQHQHQHPHHQHQHHQRQQQEQGQEQEQPSTARHLPNSEPLRDDRNVGQTVVDLPSPSVQLDDPYRRRHDQIPHQHQHYRQQQLDSPASSPLPPPTSRAEDPALLNHHYNHHLPTPQSLPHPHDRSLSDGASDVRPAHPHSRIHSAPHRLLETSSSTDNPTGSSKPTTAAAPVAVAQLSSSTPPSSSTTTKDVHNAGYHSTSTSPAVHRRFPSPTASVAHPPNAANRYPFSIPSISAKLDQPYHSDGSDALSMLWKQMKISHKTTPIQEPYFRTRHPIASQHTLSTLSGVLFSLDEIPSQFTEDMYIAMRNRIFELERKADNYSPFTPRKRSIDRSDYLEEHPELYGYDYGYGPEYGHHPKRAAYPYPPYPPYARPPPRHGDEHDNDSPSHYGPVHSYAGYPPRHHPYASPSRFPPPQRSPRHSQFGSSSAQNSRPSSPVEEQAPSGQSQQQQQQQPSQQTRRPPSPVFYQPSSYPSWYAPEYYHSDPSKSSKYPPRGYPRYYHPDDYPGRPYPYGSHGHYDIVPVRPQAANDQANSPSNKAGSTTSGTGASAGGASASNGSGHTSGQPSPPPGTLTHEADQGARPAPGQEQQQKPQQGAVAHRGSQAQGASQGQPQTRSHPQPIKPAPPQPQRLAPAPGPPSSQQSISLKQLQHRQQQQQQSAHSRLYHLQRNMRMLDQQRLQQQQMRNTPAQPAPTTQQLIAQGQQPIQPSPNAPSSQPIIQRRYQPHQQMHPRGP